MPGGPRRFLSTADIAVSLRYSAHNRRPNYAYSIIQPEHKFHIIKIRGDGGDLTQKKKKPRL